MTKILGREELLSGASFKKELVEVPELDGSLYLRDIGPGVLAFNERVKELQKDNPKLTGTAAIELMALTVSLSACDEHGALLFTDAEDVKRLTNNDIEMLSRLGAKALQISGVVMSTVNELTSEVAANLPKDPPTSSPSDSPRSSGKRKRK